jgi:O-methyltransferase
MQLLRHLHDGARNILGERLYWKLAGPILQTGFTRRLALAEFEARDIGPKGLDLLRLVEHDRAVALSLAVQYAYHSYVEGDLAEFGTATGVTARAIARAMLASERDRPTKRLHLFDSFAGHPEPTSDVDKNSFEVRTGVWKAGFPRLLSKDELFRSCSRILPAERIVMYEGWFKDTVAQLPPSQKFAFVHFHGDLYQSAIDSVGGLFERGAISNGAIICFSGYNTGQADPKRGEGGAWRELVGRFAVAASDWRAYGSLGQSFLIHDYRKP